MELTLERSEEGHGNLCAICLGIGVLFYIDRARGIDYTAPCDACTDGQLWELPSEEDCETEDFYIALTMSNNGETAHTIPVWDWNVNGHRSGVRFYRREDVCDA